MKPLHLEARGRLAPATLAGGRLDDVAEPSNPTPSQAGGAEAPAFELERVGVRFGAVTALEGVSLAVRHGERVAIIGPSGAGKSTLLNVLNTSVAPAEGRLRVLGQEPGRLAPASLRALRARVGTVYQLLHLVPQASVLENVLMGALGRRSLLGLALAPLRAAERSAVAAVLREVGLDGRLHERVDRLSGGEQQRVAVARVLFQGPEAIVADEPFASVDPRRAAAIVELLVRAARGRALVLSTHQLDPVLPHFPRVVGLRGGRVLFDRRREDLTAEDLGHLYRVEAASASPEPAQPVAPGPPRLSRAPVLVGASTTPGEYLLPRLAAAFARRHPEAHLRLTVKDTDEVMEDLLSGRVELAFVGSRRDDGALHFEDFAEDEIVLVAAPGQRLVPPGTLSTEALARLPRVEREPGSATRAVVEAQLQAMGTALDPEAVELEVSSVEALKAAVAAGLGVGFASRLSVEDDLRSGALRLVPVAGLRVPRRFYAAWRRSGGLSEGARAFLAEARLGLGPGGSP
ncbi:MAG TPA: LysR substrate-binding domain-containing protein [Anaeromyxobacteraceae bacterium]|nr:LysR substrate-binding domain-containing protein [Anaeromyxobacteraceae bacterium]